MGQGLFMAWSQPVSVEDDEKFNTWYDEVHAPEVRAAVPQVVDVRRYTLLGSGEDGGVKRYLACYHLVDGTPETAAAAAAALGAAGSSGSFNMSPAIDLGSSGDMSFLYSCE